MDRSQLLRQPFNLDFSPAKPDQRSPFRFTSPAKRGTTAVSDAKTLRHKKTVSNDKSRRRSHIRTCRSEDDTVHAVTHDFKEESENYLSAAKFAIDDKLEAVYNSLLESVNDMIGHDVSTRCAEIQLALQDINAPLDRSQIGDRSGDSATEELPSLDAALEQLAITIVKQRDVFKQLSAHHAVVNKKIQHSYEAILAMTSPAGDMRRRRRDSDLSAQSWQHTQQLQAKASEVESKGLDAIREQLKFEEKERRKIDAMLQRVWDA
ncbi:hypothetical protein K461DRAFT_320831 [Myriangium duriaei CBS 260.36]|uniref:Uncharacterized protein n=1 Tax=Myriangium duriaei CBS 260.36 TaxID=1168546 RepID=A0A9P4J2Y2_9PEZI|nr:hypothetical protein K461DRAFT_320831 [Myriangium duriaei CBS 260.36]